MSIRAAVQGSDASQYVHVERQGDFMAMAVERPSQPHEQRGGRRGVVREFSRASRRRLFQKFARLTPSRATFITLTYPDNYPEVRDAKANLRAFLERIRRAYPESSGIWRLEFQKRGAPHFHIIFYNLKYIPFAVLRDAWKEIVGVSPDETLFINVRLIQSRKQVYSYVSKYVAKVSTLFNKDAYSHAGRWWGIFNGPQLPFANRKYIQFRLKPDNREFYDVKRMLRRVWGGYSPLRGAGGVLLTDRSAGLFDAAVRLLTPALMLGKPPYIEVVAI